MTEHMSRTVTVDAAVRGKDNYKYFRRPVGQNEALPDIKYATEPVNLPTPPSNETIPLTRTVGTQSLYRESEAQTLPYSPNYVLPADGSIPEVLHLQKLGLEFGQGLPVGLAEIEMIERARQKRAFEASLPPLTGSDPAMFAQRQRMLEEQEVREQQYRANCIKKEQQERLQQLEAGLRSRDADRDKMLATRVDSMVNKRAASRDDLMDKLQTEHVKELRKLADKHKNVEQKKEKRNIIEEYSNFASKVYTAPAREGTTKTGLGSTIGNTTSNVLSNYAALDDMDMKVTQTLSPSKQELTGLRKPKMRRAEVQLATQLANVDAAIARTKNLKPAALPPPSVAQRIERPPPRPPTPTVNSELQQSQSQSPPQSHSQQFTHSRPPPRPSSTASTAPLSPSSRRGLRTVSAGAMREDETEHQEAQTRAIILLQRLLRGRAMQNQMFEGKERRRELIQELRTETSEEMLEEDKKYHEEVNQKEESEERTRAIAAAVVGMEVGSTLDFLAKELVRTRQLAAITRMVHAAETMRAQRELAEGEARRREEAQRLRVDYEYNQMQNVHALTVGTYLEEIQGEAVKHAARVHADAALAKIQAQKEEERNAQMERMRTELGDEFDQEEWEIQHFVASFLLPAVEKDLSQQDVNVQADRHSMAVRDSLHKALLVL